MANDRLRLGEGFGVSVIRKAMSFQEHLDMMGDFLMPAGHFEIEVFDAQGRPKAKTDGRNLVVNEGKQNMLTVYFSDGTQTASTSWFMGLFSDASYTGIVAGDTAASHSGWTEFTGYSQSTRPAWGQVAPGTGVTSITNSTPVTFDITSSANIKGGFIITNSTKGGTSGKLWAAALFTATVPVNNGDQMKVTYNLSC